jgi:uncharacterized protein YbjT (DUF2867 family)
MGATILLTGATGHIGGRLLRLLEAGGAGDARVRCLSRDPRRVAVTGAGTEVVRGDCLDAASLDAAFAGIDTAFYLVHSMGSGADFAALDRQAAVNFGRAAARAGVRRLIYLGGLADDVASLSPHLRSRAETGRHLRAAGVPVVELRASIVIGAGSLSFEMIRALVERLPVMICPRWVNTPAQPIAVDDVVSYLAAAVDLAGDHDRTFDIGGPEVVSYGEMMRLYARLRGLRRLLISVPVLTPRLSGLWLGLVAPAQARVGRPLVEGLRNATVVRDPGSRAAFAIEPMPLSQAFARAIEDGAATWSKIDAREVDLAVSPARAFAPIRRIGGASGWYSGDLLWRLRGWLDRLTGGPGMRRRRLTCEDCIVGDVIDDWSVEAYEPDRRLRLSADFRLPGRGWLEFQVTSLDGGRRSRIRQIATFDPRGVLGRLYWYAVYPFHAVVFGGLLRELARRAAAAEPAAEAARSAADVEGGEPAGHRPGGRPRLKRKRPMPLAEHRPVEPANDGPEGPSPCLRTSRG